MGSSPVGELGKLENASSFASRFNLRQNFAFACTPSLSPRVITWLEPTFQSKTWHLVRGQFKKQKLVTLMSAGPELAIWLRDTSQWIPCFDSCQLIITRMSNINDVPRYGAWRTDSHVKTRIFEIDHRPFYRCLLGDLAFEWQRGWRWPCFDTDLTAFVL